VLETGDDVLLPNVTDDPAFGGVESVLQLRKASVLCMPIRTSGAIAALVHLEHRQTGHFTADHRELLRTLLELAGPVLEALQAGRAVLRERDR